MSAATIEKSSVLTGRQLMLVVVVGLHALAIGGLMTMGITLTSDKTPAAFKPVTPMDDQPVLSLAPPTLEPADFVPRWMPPQVAPPNITRNGSEITWSPPDLAPVGVPGLEPGNTGASTVPDIAPTPLHYRATRSADEYYPAISMRLQEQGAAEVRVCVGPDGRIDGKPTIERGSGSRHLDAAAVKWASEALAFTPATRNGSAISACKGFRVNFNLR